MTCDQSVNFQYEGDAAMGWFQSNVNSYPPTQYTENVSYYNVDLRHEIYTQSVENTCIARKGRLLSDLLQKRGFLLRSSRRRVYGLQGQQIVCRPRLAQ